MKMEIQNLPDMNVAYVHNVGNYIGNSSLFEKLFRKLCGWAGTKGLMTQKDMIMLSVYHDDPKKTDPEKLKLDVCMTVPEGTRSEGDIQIQVLSAGKYAVARGKFKTPEDYTKAWNQLYDTLIPEAGLKFEEKPCYEIYRNDPKSDPEGIQIVDLCVPIK
jgi:AraC family transcriptional regulator